MISLSAFITIKDLNPRSDFDTEVMPKVAKLNAPEKVKKRASKAKQVPIVAVISADGGIQGTFTPEPRRPLIAHMRPMIYIQVMLSCLREIRPMF